MPTEIISAVEPKFDNDLMGTVACSDRVSVRSELITPAKAAQLLKGNSNNRNLNSRHIKSLSDEMASGRWRLNGDTIRMSGSTMIDGQHRLSACVLSGVSFETLVVYGLPVDVFDTIDAGKKRTTGDVLSINGEKNATNLASAISLASQCNAGAIRSPWSISSTEVEQYLFDNPRIRDSVSFALRHRQSGMLTPTIMSAMHYLCSEKDAGLADEFFTSVAIGINLSEDEPAHMLRLRLIHNMANKAKLPRYEIVALVIKAWNGKRMGSRIKTLRWRNTGNAQEDFPAIQ